RRKRDRERAPTREGVPETDPNRLVGVLESGREQTVVAAPLGHVEVAAHDQWALDLLDHSHEHLYLGMAALSSEVEWEARQAPPMVSGLDVGDLGVQVDEGDRAGGRLDDHALPPVAVRRGPEGDRVDQR